MSKQEHTVPAPATEISAAIDSKALLANLQETATPEVTIDSSLLVLSDIVSDFTGIRNNLHALLYEISHPYRNWTLIVPKLKAYILKNIRHYKNHLHGPEAFGRFTAIFLKALEESKKNNTLLAQTMEAILAYMEKLIALSDANDLIRYEKVFADCFSNLHALDEKIIMYMVQGHHPMKRIATSLLQITKDLPANATYDFGPVTNLMNRVLRLNYKYWLAEPDPFAWFVKECGSFCNGLEVGKIFSTISHQTIENNLTELTRIDKCATSQEKLDRILELPAHIDLVRLYKSVPEKLMEADFLAKASQAAGGETDRFSENRKLLFLFRIMETDGLALIHEETLREINRSLVHLIKRQSFEEIESFLLTTFQLLKANVRKYPHTSMQCIQVLGTEIFNRNNSRLVESFLWETVRFGFQYANVIGVDEDWQPLTNPAHLANIRVWLNLIMQEPKWCSTLFSALIINVKLSGTCVRDTDLFQRDITQLLNHPIEPIYNLAKQFAKLMPVFFNEIGAEGELRDVSTELDEIHKRHDVLIHFLRKQSHVESSNLIVDFIVAIFDFWRTKDKAILIPYLPDEVLSQVLTEGTFIDDIHKLLQHLFSLEHISKIEDLLNWEEHQLQQLVSGQKDLDPNEIMRFNLLVTMYKLLYQKYNLGFQELRQQLRLAIDSGFPEMEQLLGDLEICDTYQCLNALLTHLEELKDIILSDEKFEAKEDIYYKRHIAVDIPSVYGRYREKKFDGLGLTFRLENLANIYLERLQDTVNLSFITRATFIRIIKCLTFYLRALRIDGITSRKLDTYVALLSSSLGIKRFSYTQYLDIFRGLSSGVKDVIYAYYTNIHQANLNILIPQIGEMNLLTKYRPHWDEQDIHGSINRLTESFFRDLIAGTFGLQHLDNFITRIIQTLESQKEVLDEKSLDLLMTYNPENVISFLHKINPATNDLIHLGNKGFNLTLLASANKPVPPGFIITTEVFRCWPVIKQFSKARVEFMQQLRDSITELEKTTGRRFGYSDSSTSSDQLLLSVRSGSAVSMPGMMATIHNVGLNQDIVEEFVKESGQEYLAWDNYRRFIQSWAMAKGMNRDEFQSLMNDAKARHNVQVKRQFTPGQMKELAIEYQQKVRTAGILIPDDPWVQLIDAVEMVLGSWNTVKTRDYRTLMELSDSWGTAVIVQAMVFGNLGVQSGSGVVFTAIPYRKVSRVALWGDYAFSVQGEDIVSGLVTTYPISVEQAKLSDRAAKNTLEQRFPEIYEALLALSRELVYEKRWNPQEIEFTFVGPKAEDFNILQTRDMITIKKREQLNIFEENDEFEKNLLGKGIGVSGSAMSGRAVFTAENIHHLRQEDPHSRLILIRRDTVPEDIKEIAMTDGLLTKTCVVGCKDLKVYENEERCEINGYVINFGDMVSIDGRKGLFLRGGHQVREEVHILPL